MIGVSCDCGAYLFKIKFSPDGMAVVCTNCAAVAGVLVDTKDAEVQT